MSLFRKKAATQRPVQARAITNPKETEKYYRELETTDVDEQGTDSVTSLPIFFLAESSKKKSLAGHKMAEKYMHERTERPSMMEPSKDLDHYTNNFELSRKDFKEALLCYENNQDTICFYETYEHASGLEAWFLRVIEPPPKRSGPSYQKELKKWYLREVSKQRGRTSYCSKRLYKHIKIKRETRANIIENIEKITNLYRQYK